MSAPQRPAAVTVIAIMNFVLGGFGLLGALCGGLALVLIGSLASSMPAPPGQPNPLKELMGVVEAIPGFIPVMITSYVLGAIWSIVLIVAGIGLLRLRRWARTACLIYAVYTLLATLGSTVYTFAVVQPAMEKWQAEFLAKMQPRGAAGAPAAPAGPPPAVNMVANTAGAVAGAMISIAYAVVLLIVLNLAPVRAAFAGGGVSGTATDEAVARAWKRDEPPDVLDEGRGRLRGDDDRFQGPDER